ARSDQRHQLQGTISIGPPKVGNFNLNYNVNSGRAYTVSTGFDENRDQSFNDRPAGVKRSSLRGPGGWMLNLNWNSRPFFFHTVKKAPTPAAAPTGAAGTPNPIDQLL